MCRKWKVKNLKVWKMKWKRKINGRKNFFFQIGEMALPSFSYVWLLYIFLKPSLKSFRDDKKIEKKVFSSLLQIFSCRILFKMNLLVFFVNGASVRCGRRPRGAARWPWWRRWGRGGRWSSRAGRRPCGRSHSNTQTRWTRWRAPWSGSSRRPPPAPCRSARWSSSSGMCWQRLGFFGPFVVVVRQPSSPVVGRPSSRRVGPFP